MREFLELIKRGMEAVLSGEPVAVILFFLLGSAIFAIWLGITALAFHDYFRKT